MDKEIKQGAVVRFAGHNHNTHKDFIVTNINEFGCTLYYLNSITGAYEVFPERIPKTVLEVIL